MPKIRLCFIASFLPVMVFNLFWMNWAAASAWFLDSTRPPASSCLGMMLALLLLWVTQLSTRRYGPWLVLMLRSSARWLSW